MRRTSFAALIVACLCLPGCTWYDVWFGALGKHYSGGGTSIYEKQADYDEAVGSYRADQR